MTKEQPNNGGKHEETLFSLQMSIVLVEHLRLMSRALRKQYQVTLSEYCTLLVLDSLENGTAGTTLGTFLVFRPGTVLTILSSLEDLGFIQKRSHPIDGRAMLVSLTNQGAALAQELAKEVNALMGATFWRSLSPSEYLAPLDGLEAQLDRMRGFAMESALETKSSTAFKHALLFRTISLVVERWTDAVKTHSGLNLNEGRILLLLELYVVLTPSDIARKLHVKRSAVSCALRQLERQGSINTERDAEDGRSKTYRCTIEGLVLSRELLSALRKATLEAYGTYSNEAVLAFNMQHLRMYSDLHQVERLAKSVLFS